MRKMKAARTTPQWENLQALAVVWVEFLASGARNAGSWASVSDTTALSPLLDGTTTGARSGGGAGGSAGSGGGGAGGDRSSGTGSGASSGGASVGVTWADIWAAKGLWDVNTRSEGGAQLTDLDVGVCDGAVWRGLDELIWITGGGGAGTTGNTGKGWVLVNWVWGVEPKEVGSVISPDGEGQNVSTLERVTHSGVSTVGVEVRVVAEDALLVDTVLVGDGVEVTDTGPGVLGLKDDLAVLDPGTTDLDEFTGCGHIVSDELGDDSDLLGGIDGLSWTVEVLFTLTEGVEVATVLVANTSISVVAITALDGVLASVKTVVLADVWGIGVGDGVGFPDIHLGTAGTSLSETSVGIGGGWSPSLNVSSTTDELHVVWALSIAVTSTVLGTGLVGWVLGLTTILVHFNEVQGSVDTARHVGDIDIEGELLANGVEHGVFVVVIHQVDTRTNVGGGGTGDELEGKSIAAGGDTIGGRVVSTLKSAVSSAGSVVGAEGRIEGVSSVAIVVLVGSVVSEPTPVSVDDDLGVLGRATTRSSASGGGQARMGFGGDGTRLLGRNEGDEGGEESDFAECRHFDFLICAKD